MIVLRGIGWLLVLAGLVVLGRDILAWHDTLAFEPIALGQLWLELNRASIMRLENGLAPWIMHILRLVLTLWAAPGFLVPGLLLVLGARKGNDRHRRRR